MLSHPEQKEWIGTKTLADFEDPAIVSMAKDIENGTSGNIKTLDPTTCKEVIMFYELVKTGKYFFILVVPTDEMLAGVTALRSQLIVISTIALFLMGALGYLIALSITRPINNIVDDFKYISDGALHGKLDSRADTDVEVDFKEIPVGLNEILDALKKNFDELRRANEELHSLDKMKDEFLSNVSHELRTPLTLITGYTELLSEGTMGELNEVQIKVQKKVVRNVERLKRLVDSLLYLSKIQAGTVEYVFEPLQIREIIDVILDDLKMLADQKSIDLEMNVEEDLPKTNGDKDQLMDMFTNIIDNAIKFTHTGGKITVSGFKKDSNIHVVVKDTA